MKRLLLVLLMITIASFLFVGCLPVTPSEGEGECTGVGVINGDFETGDFSGWTVKVSDQFPQVQTIEVNSGSYAAYMSDGAEGLESPIGDTASIEQNVDIPSCAVNPVLSIYYRVDGYDEHIAASIEDFDTFYRRIAAPFEETHEPIEVLDLGAGTGIELEFIFAKAPKARITAAPVDESRIR